jgi:integrase/recombinase XerD
MVPEIRTDVAVQLATSPAILDTLESYASHLAGRKLRDRTVDTYAHGVRQFAAFLGDESTVASITNESIGRYQLSRRSLAAATLGKDISAIRSYTRWCLRARLRADDPTLELEFPKRRRRLPRPLKHEELNVLEQILARPSPVLDVRMKRIWERNRRLVIVLLYTGLRRTEVAGLVWDDVYLADAHLLVRTETAKGGHERIVPLHSRVIAELEATPLAARRGAIAGHLDGRCLSHKTIGTIFERWLNDQGLRISAHKLRHTAATELLKSGASLREVQETLGHADVRTTAGYTAIIPDRQRAAINRLPDRFGE